MSRIMDRLLEYQEFQQFIIDADTPEEMTIRLLIIKNKLGNEFQQFSFYISRIENQSINTVL